MPTNPDIEEFTRLAQEHQLVPVYRRIASDSITPVLAFHRLHELLDDGPTSSACLFESVIGGEKVGRYSFLAANPTMVVSAYGNRVKVVDGENVEEYPSENPLEDLRNRVQRVSVAHADDLPPFIGGAVGYAGYDVVRYCERLPHAPEDDRELPDLSFAFYDRMIVFDHVTKTVTVIAMADVSAGNIDAAYEAAGAVVERTIREITTGATLEPAEVLLPSDDFSLAHESNFDQPSFEAAVRKCVDYIHAGDIFQVVISQRLAIPIKCRPFEIYRTLRTLNPSPFMFYLRTPETTLVGSSPEIMCRVMGSEVTVRPLAGTRKRGATDAEDQRLAEELLADPKERAEHVMLVDLGRNDVGRVAQFDSVKISDVMSIERYSHVMHITSNVNGILRPGVDAFDALQACLPAGTVSGAPKVRAMEIIDELEPHRRGPYAGAVGYFDFSGNMDTCIALRTIVIQKQTAYLQAGAGIVADSDPTAEYQETLNKARGLLQAIAVTENRLEV
jgi:anthranilate synthase component 1